ncbi:MAG: hypothetical protein ABSF77_05255 [Spirochaetia bacterium]|jgi:hypothetical protein
MVVSGDARTIIDPDLDFVLSKLGENVPFDEKLFYFSAVFGAVNRALNAKTTPELVYLHHILSSVYAAFYMRIQAIKAGDLTVQLDEAIVSKFIEYVNELAQKIKGNLPFDEVLIKLVNLSYVTQGNGFYLYKRSELKI